MREEGVSEAGRKVKMHLVSHHIGVKIDLKNGSPLFTLIYITLLCHSSFFFFPRMVLTLKQVPVETVHINWQTHPGNVASVPILSCKLSPERGLEQELYLGVTGVERGVVVPMLPCSIRLDVEPLLCMEVRLGSFVYLLPNAPGVSDKERWLPL